MNSPYRVTGAATPQMRARTGQPPTLPSFEERPRRPLPQTRSYEISWLGADGAACHETRKAPATSVFEDAFAAIARGSLLQTQDGHVAVEDLLPGMRVTTADGGLQTVQWVGSMTLHPPREGTSSAGDKLFRIPADTFGQSRPMPDLLLGPRARLLWKSQACIEITGQAQAFAPIGGYSDGVTVFPVHPVSPVRVFHVGLRGQHALLVNGMEVESFHPGPDQGASMEPNTRIFFLTLFPHIQSLQDFGPMDVGRLTRFELERMRGG